MILEGTMYFEKINILPDGLTLCLSPKRQCESCVITSLSLQYFVYSLNARQFVFLFFYIYLFFLLINRQFPKISRVFGEGNKKLVVHQLSYHKDYLW